MKVIYWNQDPAACNIVENLRELGFDEKRLSGYDESLLFLEEIDETDVDFFVIPSTHKSEAERCTLSVHPTGNWGSADVGGNPHELAYAAPAAMKVGLRAITEANLPEYEVSLEVTHHGPTSWKKPLLFLEIGSNESQWKDKEAGRAIAEAILKIDKNTDEFENYVGFGGIHYAHSFTAKILKNDEIAVGHMAAKYAVENLDEEIVKEAFEKSNAEKALIDWKGLKSEERNKVIGILDSLGFEYKKTKEL